MNSERTDLFIKFINGSRASGKTHTMMKGVQALAKKKGARITVFTATEAQGKRLKQDYPGKYHVAILSLNNLAGLSGTLVVDHYLYEKFISDLLNERKMFLGTLEELLGNFKRNAV